MLIYPNPTQGLISIQISNGYVEESFDIELFNSFGVQIMQKSSYADRNVIILDISSLSDGIYFLKMNQNNKKVYNFKVVKLAKK